MHEVVNDEQRKPPKKPLVYYAVIAMIVIMLLNALVYPSMMRAEVKEVGYDQFLEMIDENKVTEVAYNESDGEFVFVTGKGEDQQYYKTGIWPDDGERLLQQLREHSDIKFSAEIPTQTNPLLSMILTWILPIFILFIVGELFYLWLRWIDNFFGVGYQFMTLAAFTEVSPERLVKSVPYILVLFIVLFVNGIKMNTSRRLADTDNIRRDMIKSVLMNAVIAGAAVAILLIVNYGSCLLRQGCGVFHFTEGHSSVGSLNFAFAFPFLMGSMGALNTYFFRKTGTVWLGAFLTAIIAGITAFVAQPLVM